MIPIYVVHSEPPKPTTTVPITTSTTVPPTTTTVPPTTTTTIERTAELVVIEFFLVFEQTRETIIEIWAEDINVESVDKYVAEAEDAGELLSVQVILDVTSGWAHPDNQHDGAWEITRSMAILYEEDGAWYDELWVPVFRLVNSGRAYQCAGDFMVQLADSRQSRADWEEQCQ